MVFTYVHTSGTFIPETGSVGLLHRRDRRKAGDDDQFLISKLGFYLNFSLF